MAEVFETNPYLILYSGVLKPPPRPANALLDPPRSAGEIAARWSEVDGRKSDGVGTADYERNVYNAKLPEIKKLLVDCSESERCKWIGEALKEIERRFLERVETFRMGRDPVITKIGLERASAGFARWLKKDTMAELAKRAGYKVVDEVGPAEKPLPVPPKPQDWPDKNQRAMGVIDKNLPKFIAFLAVHENRRMDNVYEFLHAAPTSPLSTLKAKLAEAHAKYNTANASLVNKTPHLQAASSLFRVLDEVFQTDESRRKWERCMVLTRIEERLASSFMARISSGAVSAESYLDAVEKCREEGLSKPDADYYVYEYYIIEKKCPMPRRAVQKEAQSESRFCGLCHAANPPGAKNCRQCGAPLDVICPNLIGKPPTKCGKKVEYGDGHCPHCGFAVGDMPLALPLLKEAKDDLAKNDIAEALAKVKRALEYWPTLDDAKKLQSEITKRVQELDDIGKGIKAKEEAARAESERQSAIIKFNESVRNGCYDEAEGLFPGLASKGVVGKDLDALKGKLAVARFDTALEIFQFDKASELIRDVVRYGVDSESNLKARVATAKNGKMQSARTSFGDALSKKDITEKDIAKAESLLVSLRNSGCSEREAAQMQKRIDEKKQEIANARTSKLVGQLEKVVSLEVKGSENGAAKATITWEPAKSGTRASGWMVKRLSEEHDVDIEPFTTRPQCIDKTVKLGVEYTYVVIPVFVADAENKDVRPNMNAATRSKPVVCRDMLEPGALKGNGEGEQGLWGTATLSWTLPPNVDVHSQGTKLLLSRADGALRDVNLLLPPTGGALKNIKVTDKSGSCVDESVASGKSYEYRLDLILAGKPSGMSSVEVTIKQIRQPEPVLELTAERLPNDRWLVKWKWPEGMDHAIVSPVSGGVVIDGKQLEAADGARPVTFDDSKNGVEVFVPAAAAGIAVCTYKDRPGGNRTYSELKTVPTKQTVVLYGFIKPFGIFRKAPEVVIWSDTSNLPDLVLVEGRTGKPVEKEAGMVVATIPTQYAVAPARIRLHDKARTDCMKLFLSNPKRDADKFKIALPVHVPKDLLQ